METITKSVALETINEYEDIIKSIPILLEESGETLVFWTDKLGISTSAISNKKNGRREWKISEVKIILTTLKKDSSIVERFTNVLANIDTMIGERGYKKMFIYHKVGLTNMQMYTRSHDYTSWAIDEVRRVVQVL